MIRHMVLFRFRPDLGAADRAAVLDGLARLPASFPAMRRFGLGENVSRRDRTFTHAMAVEFDSMRQLDDYLESPLHEGFVSGTFRPAIEDRVIASFE